MKYYEITYLDSVGKKPDIMFDYDKVIDLCLDEEMYSDKGLNMVNEFEAVGDVPNSDVDKLVRTIWTEEEGFLEVDPEDEDLK